MMRELKATEAYQSVVADNSAAAQIPMMRELKATEAYQSVVADNSAAAQIPMMRELKGWLRRFFRGPFRRCSPNPYDEGTESPRCSRTSLVLTTAAAQIPMMRELKVYDAHGHLSY